jgi:hypothetical protein
MESFQIQVDYQMNEEDAAVITKGLGEFNTPFLVIKIPFHLRCT